MNFCDFVCKKRDNSVNQNLKGIIDGSNLTSSLCNAPLRSCHTF